MDQYAEEWKPRLALASYALVAGGTVFACVWGSAEMQIMMLTACVLMAREANGFFFGSSSGAQKKDETIAAQGVMLAQSHPPSPPPPAPGADMQSTDPEVEALRHQVQ